MERTIIDIVGRGVAYGSVDCCNALGIKGLSSGASAGAATGVVVDRDEASRSASERCLDKMLGWRERMCRSGEMRGDSPSFSF